MTAMPESRVFQLCRNLLDAGCDAPLIERFLALEQAGEREEREEQRRLLARHKVALLEKLHAAQYRIDCLDHLLYALQSDETRNGGF